MNEPVLTSTGAWSPLTASSPDLPQFDSRNHAVKLGQLGMVGGVHTAPRYRILWPWPVRIPTPDPDTRTTDPDLASSVPI